MPFPVGTLRVTAAVALLALSLAACGDDDNTNPPATPPAPTGLAAELSDDGTSVEVSWTAVSGATSYVLERAEGSPPGSFTELADTITGTTYTDTDIVAGTAYSYHVAAANDAGPAISAVP